LNKGIVVSSRRRLLLRPLRGGRTLQDFASQASARTKFISLRPAIGRKEAWFLWRNEHSCMVSSLVFFSNEENLAWW
jgi:hypothetical protein